MQEQVPFLFFYYVGTRSRCGTCMNVLLLNNCSLPTAGTAVYTELPGCINIVVCFYVLQIFL